MPKELCPLCHRHPQHPDGKQWLTITDEGTTCLPCTKRINRHQPPLFARSVREEDGR